MVAIDSSKLAIVFNSMVVNHRRLPSAWQFPTGGNSMGDRDRLPFHDLQSEVPKSGIFPALIS